MPYFINVYRVPKPGQFTAVAKGVEESIKALGRPGFVNIPVSPPMPFATGLAVISTVGGMETPDDVDALFDSLLDEDMAGFAGREQLAAMCDQVSLSVSRIMNPPGTRPEGFVPKIISRTFAVAKPGKGPELMELLLDWREELDFRGNTVVSVPLGGQAGEVRVTQIVESLQALEDLRGQIAASPRVQKFVELVNAPVTRGVGRITYMNRP